MNSIEILDRLLAFPTVSHESNLDLIEFVRDLLSGRGVECRLVEDESGSKANLFATVGPAGVPGVMLSGHTDVVPVEGQDWTVPPFAMSRRDGLLLGRGAADMKGFIACALSAALRAGQLRTPLHLALSHDEEIGCIGVRRLIDVLEAGPIRPLICIVGEPTSMQVATGHKGKTTLKAVCRGREGHTAMAPLALNALHLACDFTDAVRALQARLAEEGARDGDYDVPYTTLNVARIDGGVAANIVPNRAEVAFEIRHIAADNSEALIDGLRRDAAAVVEAAEDQDAAIDIEVVLANPGLDTAPDARSVRFVQGLTGANGTIKVPFGTEGGLFAERLGLDVVICGPGSMAQGHKPDEYVSVDQMERCDAMMDALLERLAEGF